MPYHKPQVLQPPIENGFVDTHEIFESLTFDKLPVHSYRPSDFPDHFTGFNRDRSSGVMIRPDTIRDQPEPLKKHALLVRSFSTFPPVPRMSFDWGLVHRLQGIAQSDVITVGQVMDHFQAQ